MKKWNLRWPVEVLQMDNKLPHVEINEQCRYMGIRLVGFSLVLK
jgi:hypothetical protein